MASTHQQVNRYILTSYESTWGLPEGQYVTYFCAYDADSAQRLYETESVYPDETARLVAEHYPDALLVAEIAVVEPAARL